MPKKVARKRPFLRWSEHFGVYECVDGNGHLRAELELASGSNYQLVIGGVFHSGRFNNLKAAKTAAEKIIRGKKLIGVTPAERRERK